MIGHGRRWVRSPGGLRDSALASAARAPILAPETTPSLSGPPVGRAERGNHLGAFRGVRGASPDRESGSADRPREPVSSPRRPTTDRGPLPARIRTPRRRLRGPARARAACRRQRLRARCSGSAARRPLLPTTAGVSAVTPRGCAVPDSPPAAVPPVSPPSVAAAADGRPLSATLITTAGAPPTRN